MFPVKLNASLSAGIIFCAYSLLLAILSFSSGTEVEILVFSFVHKKICNDSKITLKITDLLFTQPGDLEYFYLIITHKFIQTCRYFHQRFDIFSVMSFSPIGFAPFLLFFARSCYGCMIPVSAASCRSLFWIFLPNGNEFRFVSEPLCSYDNSLCDVCQRFCFFCPGSIIARQRPHLTDFSVRCGLIS